MDIEREGLLRPFLFVRSICKLLYERRVIEMILLGILMMTMLLLIVVMATLVSIGGAAFILLFGDVIVCVVFLALLIRHLLRKRK